MILLTEEECREILAHPVIKKAVMAGWIYEGAEDMKSPPRNALERILSVKEMSELTRLRVSSAVYHHFRLLAEAYLKVRADDGEVII